MTRILALREQARIRCDAIAAAYGLDSPELAAVTARWGAIIRDAESTAPRRTQVDDDIDQAIQLANGA